MYIVTIKLHKNPNHNPHSKKIATCPINHEATCTDATGEHHSFLVRSPLTLAQVRDHFAKYYHVTRVEEAFTAIKVEEV